MSECSTNGNDNSSGLTHFSTGAIRDDHMGKGRLDLLPPCALLRLAKHYEKGALLYGEDNWQKGIPLHSYIDSAIRHLFKYQHGLDDEDHLTAVAWNILCAMWTEENMPEMIDIPTRQGTRSFSYFHD